MCHWIQDVCSAVLGERTNRAQPGTGGKDQGAALGMIDGPPLETPAVRHAHHDRRAECVGGPPAYGRELVAELMIGGPDVIEKLDLDDRLEAPGCEPDGSANDVGFGQG